MIISLPNVQIMQQFNEGECVDVDTQFVSWHLDKSKFSVCI